MQIKRVTIRPWGKQEECEQTGRREAAVEEVWYKREGTGFMENDTGGEPGYGRKAWAGGSEDRAVGWIAEEQSQRVKQEGYPVGH